MCVFTANQACHLSSTQLPFWTTHFLALTLRGTLMVVRPPGLCPKVVTTVRLDGHNDAEASKGVGRFSLRPRRLTSDTWKPTVENHPLHPNAKPCHMCWPHCHELHVWVDAFIRKQAKGIGTARLKVPLQLSPERRSPCQGMPGPSQACPAGASALSPRT